MGCGKSKPKDVVTGNTIVTTRKNVTSNDDDNAEEPKKISKDRETIIQEKPTTTTTNEETVENVNQEEDDHENHETEKAVQVAAAPEVKEIPENMEIILDDNHQEQEIVAESTVVVDQNVENEGNEEQEEIVAVAVAVGVEEQIVESAGERLISRDSPNHFYSSRKDEEAVGSVVSEISSEYDSPRHDNVKADEKESEIDGQPATIKEVEEATTVTAPEATTAAAVEKEVKVGEEQLIESSQPKI